MLSAFDGARLVPRGRAWPPILALMEDNCSGQLGTDDFSGPFQINKEWFSHFDCPLGLIASVQGSGRRALEWLFIRVEGASSSSDRDQKVTTYGEHKKNTVVPDNDFNCLVMMRKIYASHWAQLAWLADNPRHMLAIKTGDVCLWVIHWVHFKSGRCRGTILYGQVTYLYSSGVCLPKAFSHSLLGLYLMQRGELSGFF